MEIIETGNGQPPIRQTTRAPVAVNRGKTGTASGNKVSTLSGVITTSMAQDQVTFGRLQAINDQSNREALRFRDDQRYAGEEDTPYRIIKNYPPYPIDDPDRAKFLMSFNGLKREIEQMTIPPDSKWLGTPQIESNPPDQMASAPLIGSSNSPFPDQPANNEVQPTGQAPWSADSVTPGGVSQEKLVFLATISGDDLNLSIPDEAEAVVIYTRGRQELAGTMNGSITKGQSQLLALAG
jgi:hypothetical protein